MYSFLLEDCLIQWVYHSSPGQIPGFGDSGQRVFRVLLSAVIPCHHTQPLTCLCGPSPVGNNHIPSSISLLATCALSHKHHLHALSPGVLDSMCSHVAGQPRGQSGSGCGPCWNFRTRSVFSVVSILKISLKNPK